jgi:hypothetical protein
LERAEHIYQSFVQPGEAMFEINIAGNILMRIQDGLR